MTKPVCYVGRCDVARICGPEEANYQPALEYLTQHVLQLSQQGYSNFMASTEQGIGQLACLAILKAREQNPNIKLIAFVPFSWHPNLLKKTGMFSRKMHQEIVQQADEIREAEHASVYNVYNNYSNCNYRMQRESALVVGVTEAHRRVFDDVEDIVRFSSNSLRLEYITPGNVMEIL